MSRFTIFTIILSVSVVTVLADLAVRDYFDEGQASVITDGRPSDSEATSIMRPEDATFNSAASQPTEPPSAPSPEPAPAPQPAPAPVPESVLAPISAPQLFITPEKIKEAGFTGKVSEAHFPGKVYQLLDITQHPVDNIGLFEISADTGPVASVTEIVLRDEIRALQLYVLLQNKTKPYIDLSLNETNAYGDRSFYVNHAKKPDEAFLTVKIRNRIYSIAYVKFYHPEIKKLIQLLSA